MKRTEKESGAKLTNIGVFKTKIVGTQYYENSCKTDDELFLDRNPRNEFDSNAIEVRNMAGILGHLKREHAAWLGPLIDAGEVYLKGEALDGGDNLSAPILLKIHVTLKGERILKPYPNDNASNVIHNHLLAVFNDAANYSEQVIRELRHSYRGMMEMETILPETHLIFKLLKERAAEIRRSKSCILIDQALASLEKLKCGEIRESDGITVIPLFSNKADKECRYASGKTALENGTLVVEELNESGVVSQLRATNRGDKPVILLNGQGVKGAKQDRIVNVTVIIEVNVSVVIPVSCVERGRWADTSDTTFKPANFATSELRRKLGSIVNSGIANGTSGFDGDQGEVWDMVSDAAVKNDVVSITENLNDVYAAKAAEIDEVVEELDYQEGSVGIAVFKEDEEISLDIFQHPDLMADNWNDIIRSVTLYSHSAKSKKTKNVVLKKRVSDFLKNTRKNITKVERSPGRGEYAVSRSDVQETGILIDEGEIVHLSGFKSGCNTQKGR
ncbi:MAG: HIRAN domain-containing protein [Victivallales bacterium]|nr:HIRAN domain-containing protein [Victivallales bacterium]